MEFGRKLAEARRAKNLTQEQLAELMQVTRQTVSRWESQTAYPEMEKVVSLASILNVSCDYLFNDRIESPDGAPAPELSKKRAERNPVTRLLEEAAGKTVKISFFSEGMDLDISSKKAVITDFDGSWAHIAYKAGKKTETKLIPISAIASIKFEKEDETWKL